MADDIYRHSATLPGFVSATYVVSDDETSYGAFSVWQSREEAQAGGESIREKVMPVLQGLVTAPPEVSVMEIYEPKQTLRQSEQHCTNKALQSDNSKAFELRLSAGVM